MAAMNVVIVCGNVTRDPELRYIPSGQAVCDLGIAINDRRKDASGEWVEDTTFVDVTVWGRQAETASEFLGKGSTVLVHGRLKLEQWEKDGAKHSKVKIVAERVQWMSTKKTESKPELTGVSGAQTRRANKHQREAGDENELPTEPF